MGRTGAPMGAAGRGRRRPGAPLWCSCSSSLTRILGAAALRVAWGIPLGFVSFPASVAGHEQRGVEQHDSLREQVRAGAVVGQVRPSGAAAAPTPTPVLGAAAPGITYGSSLGLFRARQRRWARAAGRGVARQPPWAGEGWGRRRPDAPLWCGCCSSLTLIIGAAALSVA